MTNYTDDHKNTMREIIRLAPAFKEFSGEVIKDLTEALTNLLQIEKSETQIQAEMYRTRGIQSINSALRKFIEIGAV